VGRSDLIERHAELADGMLPWALGLFVVAVGLWLLDRRRGRSAGAATPGWLPIVASALAVVAVVGTVQQIVRVGYAGAEGDLERRPLHSLLHLRRRPGRRRLNPGARIVGQAW
jgi:hypothetical protein